MNVYIWQDDGLMTWQELFELWNWYYNGYWQAALSYSDITTVLNELNSNPSWYFDSLSASWDLHTSAATSDYPSWTNWIFYWRQSITLYIVRWNWTSWISDDNPF